MGAQPLAALKGSPGFKTAWLSWLEGHCLGHFYFKAGSSRGFPKGFRNLMTLPLLSGLCLLRTLVTTQVGSVPWPSSASGGAEIPSSPVPVGWLCSQPRPVPLPASIYGQSLELQTTEDHSS